MAGERIITADRSIVVAADVEGLSKYRDLVKQTGHTVGGFKVGFMLGLNAGLPNVVDATRDLAPNAKVIYDHQKAGNDIPDTAKGFARSMRFANVDAAILFPFTGPDVQEAWTKALQDQGVGVIVGGNMTHDHFLASDNGYIDDQAPWRIYEKAAEMGVHDFVVPGNQPSVVRRLHLALSEAVSDPDRLTLWAPGFVAQGGEISEAGKYAGERFHAIVGRGITAPKSGTMREAAESIAAQLR